MSDLSTGSITVDYQGTQPDISPTTRSALAIVWRTVGAIEPDEGCDWVYWAGLGVSESGWVLDLKDAMLFGDEEAAGIELAAALSRATPIAG